MKISAVVRDCQAAIPARPTRQKMPDSGRWKVSVNYRALTLEPGVAQLSWKAFAVQ
jgi:hypothetical protein